MEALTKQLTWGQALSTLSGLAVVIFLWGWNLSLRVQSLELRVTHYEVTFNEFKKESKENQEKILEKLEKVLIKLENKADR